MGKAYSPDLIPEVGVQLDAGRYLFRIAELDDSEVTTNNNYQIVTKLEVIEPKAFEGSPHYEYFVIGNPEDPTADDPETWKSYSAGRYKQMMSKAGIELSGDVESDIAAATGQNVGGIVSRELQPMTQKGGQPNPRGGQWRSRVAAFFRPGEREIGLDASPNGPTATAPKPAPRAPATAASAAKPAPTPAAKPGPKAAAPKATPAAVPAKKEQMLPCAICNELVPRSQYGAHVNGHDGSGEEE